MASSENILEVIREMINTVANEIISNRLTTTSTAGTLNANQSHQNISTSNGPILIKIAEINTNITFPWKIQAVITRKYPKRIFNKDYGPGEVSNWDLSDDSGSITLTAFNLNSNLMSNKLKEDKAYEFTNLSIGPASDAYKKLPHPFQITCTDATRVQEINLSFDHSRFDFTHLKEVETLSINSIIDIQVRVLRDFGISTGTTNDKIWSRRALHVDQDGTHIRLTLWNNLARLVTSNMAGMQIKLKHVKISCFDGCRSLTTMANTELFT